MENIFIQTIINILCKCYPRKYIILHISELFLGKMGCRNAISIVQLLEAVVGHYWCQNSLFLSAVIVPEREQLWHGNGPDCSNSVLHQTYPVFPRCCSVFWGQSPGCRLFGTASMLESSSPATHRGAVRKDGAEIPWGWSLPECFTSSGCF